MKQRDRYSWRAIGLHWLMALLVIGLFVLGLVMVDLDYYSPWYTRAPAIHESIGAVAIFLFLARVLNRLVDGKPAPLPSISPATHRLAGIAHLMLYLLLALQLATGYLISTADNTPLTVFSGVTLPALSTGLEGQADSAGQWHRNIAWALISLVLVHSLATLKHHFIDRDRTLLRMLGCSGDRTDPDDERHR